MGMTMAEKALSRAAGKQAVHPGEFVTANVDLLMGHDLSFFAAYLAMVSNGRDKVWDPDKIVVVIDHYVPAPNKTFAGFQKNVRENVAKQGIKNFYDSGEGICHQVLPEKGHALPGRLIVGGDSHTTTYGALAAASTGIGISELAYVMAEGSLWFMVPETIKFNLSGALAKGVSAKDIILYIAGRFGSEVAQYKAIEFSGAAAGALSIDQRMTMSNFGVELGAKFAFFEADEKTRDWLKQRTDQPIEPFGPDPDARYSAIHEIDISALEPQVACPHNVDNVKPVSDIGEVKVDQAFLGSCTNGRFEDFRQAAAILKGKKVHPGTRLIVIPASRSIYNQSIETGILKTLVEAQAVISPPGCGPCGGGHQGVLAPEEVAISSTNRNFKGRMGSPESFIYLGSAETVAASAIEGKIADPRKYI
jgi:3-isopropylmalate/(R)-2-methylmalate dehydratase large subunit